MSSLPWRHIAIEGPIGVGKTSLTSLLAKRFRGTKVLEDADNPFLDDFYKDKRGAAFRTELFFLLSRFDQMRQFAQQDLFTELILTDYTFARSKVFAYLTLDDSELMIYNRLYDLLYEQVARPEYTVRFKWEPGSVAFWDNRAVLHLAPRDQYHLPDVRVLHRITLVGDIPVGPDGRQSEPLEGEFFGAA